MKYKAESAYSRLRNAICCRCVTHGKCQRLGPLAGAGRAPPANETVGSSRTAYSRARELLFATRTYCSDVQYWNT
jgi:hypothetical protein